VAQYFTGKILETLSLRVLPALRYFRAICVKYWIQRSCRFEPDFVGCKILILQDLLAKSCGIKTYAELGAAWIRQLTQQSSNSSFFFGPQLSKS